jgi:hypothetical protein
VEALIVPVGLLLGYIISHFSKSELKKGRKYFVVLQAILFGVIVAVAMWPETMIGAVIAGLVGFLLTLRISNPVILMAVIGIATHYSSYVNALAFIYAIPSASKEYPKKRRLIIAAILFLAIAFIPF